MKAVQILSDNRNYFKAKEIGNVQRTLINCSKNFRQLINDDKYVVNINRCLIYMEHRDGSRNHIVQQHDFNTVIYQCSSLQLVTRTNITKRGNKKII